MQKVIMISRDPKVLESGSYAFKRLEEYKTLFEELHILVMRGNIVSLISSFFVAARYAKKVGRGAYITAQDIESGIVALLIAKLYGLRLQLQVHTDIFNPAFRRHSILDFIRSLLARIIIPFADSVRVVSDRIANSIKERDMIEPKKILVLPIYTDIEELQSHASDFNLKDKYKEFGKIILITSRLEKEKNLTLALTAFQKMLRKMPNLGLVIAGSGREDKRLHEYARHLGVLDKVKFEGWISDITPLYKSADLLLSTSFYEGYGLSIVVALACGCPVVSTDVGIAREAGATISGHDAGEIALKSLDILENGRRGALSKNFKMMTKQEYLEKFRQTFL